MAEKAKKRVLPWVLAIVMSALLAISGASILGTEFVQANTRSATSATETDTDADEGMEEATEHSYSTTTNSTTGAKTYTFAYTGGVQSIALPYGQYKLEVWGAQGAANRRGHAGGYGGYAAATINITAASKTIYVVVGGAGVTSTGVMPSNTNYVGGGYNGGGATASGLVDRDSMNQSGGGGGATHIATVSSLLSARSSNYSSTVYLVAGGGGGAGHGDAPTPAYATGCRGGGSTGGNAPSETNYTHDSHGKGGSQTAGGAIGAGYYTTEQEGAAGYNRSVTAGSFGQGGRGAGRYGGGGGGGGGFYGGSGGLVAGGGGGSGWVNPSTTMTLSTGRTNTTSTQTGNGRAVITQINTVPTQSSVPTFTLNRTNYSSVKFDSVESVTATYSLNCSDADTRGSREVVRANVAGIYMSAATTTPATLASNGNYWLEVSGLSTTASTFSIRAKRWWSGTKTFYMQIRDYNTSYSASPG
ncbi:MAG: hypothetical protein K2L51_04940, partial [Clostridiales bacterium]|nr:hypothetical protein [Clostridiales bacterium]